MTSITATVSALEAVIETQVSISFIQSELMNYNEPTEHRGWTTNIVMELFLRLLLGDDDARLTIKESERKKEKNVSH